MKPLKIYTKKNLQKEVLKLACFEKFTDFKAVKAKNFNKLLKLQKCREFGCYNTLPHVFYFPYNSPKEIERAQTEKTVDVPGVLPERNAINR